ncbi:MAG: hypothetical protein EPN21_09270 [Methylococcaceae bacterium]|nr:MAG: hypothetical protein EPN21_09270 [Methylococcaceae bacterium]
MSNRDHEESLQWEITRLLADCLQEAGHGTAKTVVPTEKTAGAAYCEARKIEAVAWGARLMLLGRMDQSLTDAEFTSRISLMIEVTEEKARRLGELLVI